MKHGSDEQLKELASKFKFPRYDIDSLTSYKEDPRQYIMGRRGFLRRGAGSTLIGFSHMGKSVFSIQLGMCVATGTKFLGEIHVGKPARVLVLQAENDAGVLRRSVLSIEKNLELDHKTIKDNFIIEKVSGICDETFAAYLERVVIEVKPTLVIVDPYHSFTSGDLNSTSAMDIWVQQINPMMEEYNFGIMLNTHTPKPRDRSEWDIRQMGYMSLGSSRQTAWARSSMEMHYVKGDMSRYMVTVSKGYDDLDLRNEDGSSAMQFFIERSQNKDEPFWSYSVNQAPNMAGSASRIIEATILQFPDMGNKDIIFKITQLHKGLKVTTQAVCNVRTRMKRAGKIKTKK